MSDRYNYLTVALEKDIRDDDSQCIIDAIKMIRGVLDVKPNIVNGLDFTAEERVRREYLKKLQKVFEI